MTASGLYGSVSGSPTADVATTGPLTIPIMKKMGIPAVRAGAIEATASSGGAMLPPVMGAVAFIMSDITGIPYARIAWASVLPALLYYYCIYLLVHNEAVRHNEPRLPEDQIVPLGRPVRRRLFFQSHGKPESGPLARGAADADLAAHAFDQLLADHQTETSAAVFARGRAVGLAERLEKPRLRFRRNARARVRDFKPQQDLLRRLLNTGDFDKDFSSFGEFDGVSGEIENDLA